MYKIDNKYQKARIKNLEQRLDFQKYNIKEKKQKEKIKKKKKRKKKATRIIKKQQQQQQEENTNNHPKTIYGVCLKKQGLFFFEKLQQVIEIKIKEENF